MKFDKTTASTFNKDVQSALNVLAAKYGLKLTKTRGRYDEGSFRGTFEFTVPGVHDPDADLKMGWGMFSGLEGLKDEWLGGNVTLQGQVYKIVGYNSRAPKMPIICERNGKRVKTNVATIKRALGA